MVARVGRIYRPADMHGSEAATTFRNSLCMRKRSIPIPADLRASTEYQIAFVEISDNRYIEMFMLPPRSSLILPKNQPVSKIGRT